MDASTASIQPNPSPSANQQPPSTSSTGPQIRSRVTVVCGECKRLKLKCDRKTPCASCRKRGTVIKCIYSPAAAEKLDVYTLNNRLVDVEAELVANRSALETFRAFQSTYPFSNQQGAIPAPSSSVSSPFSYHQGSQHHQHHHHHAAPSSHSLENDAILLSNQDLASIWLDDLDLGVSFHSSYASSSSASSSARHLAFSNAGYVKLESSPPVDVELNHPRSYPFAEDRGGTNLNGSTTSRPSSPIKRSPFPRYLQQQRCSAQELLPALSIYYPVPAIPPPGSFASSSAPFPYHPSTSSSAPPASPSGTSGYNSPPQPQYVKPQVTPPLLALLPPLSTCTRLLQSALGVFRVRPLPFDPCHGNGWKTFEKKCIALLWGDNTKGRERKDREREKDREARRARQIYFDGIPGLQQPQPQDTEMDDDGSRNTSRQGEGGGEGDVHSLAFFAMMCAVLAVGATISPSSTPSHTGTNSPLGMASSSTASLAATTESPAFFYALSRQAMGVWDTHVSSSPGSSVVDETEKMDYLLACLVGVIYLLLSGSAGAGGQEEVEGESGLVYALVGKMVNAAREMGLGRDGSSSRKSKLGLPGRGSRKEKEAEKEKERVRDEWRRMIWWEVLFYDLFTADVLGHQPYIPAYSYTTKLPACAAPVPTVLGDGDEADSEYEDDDLGHGGMGMHQDDYDGRRPRHVLGNIKNTISDEEAYLGARYRLTQLAQTIKSCISRPDCCCGYTLDQAASLEGEIRYWQAGLPLSLTWSASGSSDDIVYAHVPPPFHQSSVDSDKVLKAQSAELAMMANVLMLKVYTPFLRHASAVANASPESINISSPQGSSGDNHSPVASAAAMSSPASRATVPAAQAIIRAAVDLQAALVTSTSATTTTTSVLPAMFDFYPLDKLVFDSVVICAHAGFTGKASTFVFDGRALMNDVVAGLNVFSGVPSTADNWVSDAQKKVVEALYKRLVHRGMNLNMKRKHDQVDLRSYGAAATAYSPSSNGAAGGGGGDDMMFAFNSNNSQVPGQYLHNGLPVTQQQHSGLVDLSSSASPTSTSSAAPPLPPLPPPSLMNFPQDRLRRTEKQKEELASALAARASAHLSAARRSGAGGSEDKAKEKKSRALPAVGIRMRVRKETPVVRSRNPSVSGSGAAAGGGGGGGGGMQAPPPLMTSTPRPLPGAFPELVLAHKQKQTSTSAQAGQVGGPAQQSQTPSPGSVGSLREQEAYRSRSSSLSRVQSEQQASDAQSRAMDYSVPFGHASSAEVMDMHSMQRKRFGVQDSGPQQQQQAPPQHPPYTSHMYDQGQQSHPQSMYDQPRGPFEPPLGPSEAVESMGYNPVSSPFSNASGTLSASSSPFASTSVASSGHPSTPTFGSNRPTPPVFSPHPPPLSNSPTTHFHTPSAYDASYGDSPSSSSNLVGHHTDGQGMSVADMGMDQSMISVPGTPVYEKTRLQATMYEVKPAMDNLGQHHHMLQQQQEQEHRPQQQQQHIQHQTMGPSYDDQDMPGQSQRFGMGMTVSSPWPPPPPPQQTQPFWNNEAEFKYYRQ